MNWEYKIVSRAVGHWEDLQAELLALGSLGWKAVGIAGVTLMGPNELTVLMRRKTHGLPPPPVTDAAWITDPSGRFAQRYWDGLRWTEHVSAGGGQRDVDAPNVR